MPNAIGDKVHTLPIRTEIFFPSLQLGNNSGFNVNITSYFTLTVLPPLGIPEYLGDIVNTWGSPVKELVGWITASSGIGVTGYIVNKIRNSKVPNIFRGLQKRPKPRSPF